MRLQGGIKAPRRIDAFPIPYTKVSASVTQNGLLIHSLSRMGMREGGEWPMELGMG